MSRDAKNNPNFKHNAKTQKSKRPNHVDFLTTEEHKKNKTTGVRKNDIALQYEYWILGNIEKVVTFAEAARDKNALAKAHVEVFAMGPAYDPTDPRNK